ncbi:glycosyltransferase family 8 protein [Micromonospora sp. NPDC000089]|uniref:glycosyltransferase family 8 protein n=1 Tax=unclassified Micromonospora TaxID=2617518 RepID=UPI0036BB3128
MTAAPQRDPVVCVCVDDNYAPGARVALRSAIRNTDAPFLPMVVDCGLGAESIAALRAAVPGVAIVGADSSRALEGLATATLNELLTSAMYGRLIAPRLVPEGTERLIYLDADMLVVDSLEPLFTAELHGGVGAVEDTWVDPGHARTLVGADSDVPWNHRPYLNSGMLVIELAAWRSRRVSEQALDYVRARPTLRTPDQDALNVVLHDGWHRLDPKWNHYVQRPGKSPDVGTREWTTGESSAVRPAIYHFIGRRKPWKTRYLPADMHELYDSYLLEARDA